MTDGIVLNGAFRNNLLAIKDASRLIDRTSLRLASGLEVNTALDSPQNFFAARALDYRASDLSRLLDNIAQSRRVVEEAAKGVEAIENLLQLAENEAQTTLEDRQMNGELSSVVDNGVDPLDQQILDANPVGYWRLNEGGGAAINYGSIGAAVNGTYLSAPTFNAGSLYGDDDDSVAFNGTNEALTIPNHNLINLTNHPRRTVEIVFNANTTAGRQVLYEEGGGTNAFSIYVFNGRLYTSGRDAGAWGPANISAPIVAGETYHAAFTFDFPGGIFRGYLNGVEMGNAPVTATFPSHSGAIGIGRMNNATWFHDGSQSGNGFYFNGRISDVAIYNTVLTLQDMEDHYASVFGDQTVAGRNERFESILSQIDLIAQDANYRGINLLLSDTLKTFFNESNTHFLETKGVNFTADGLGIKRTDFNKIADIEDIIESVRDALQQVRAFGTRLTNNFSIISTREAFTRETIVTLNAGAMDLTQADMNEEGANLLAMQTRVQMATTSLALASQASTSVLNLFA